MSVLSTVRELLSLAGAPVTAALWRARVQAQMLARAYDIGKLATDHHVYRRELGSGDSAIDVAGSNPREIAREFDQNHDLVVGVLNCLVDHIIGSGIRVEPVARNLDGTLADGFNREIANLRRLTMPFLDVTGQSKGGAFERLCALTYFRDGEVFGKHIAVAAPGLDFRGAVPYAVEGLEPDFVPFDLIDSQRRVLHGIRINAWRRPLSYFVHRTHPSNFMAFQSVGFGDVLEIDAGQMMHMALRRRLHQLRGMSVLHAVLSRIDSIRQYEKSEELAARLAAAFTAVITRPQSTRVAGFGQRTDGATGDRTMEIQPGLIMDAGLEPGEGVEILDPKRPNSNLGSYRNSLMKMVAAGTSAIYSTIARTHEGNYASQRMERVDARPALEALTEMWACGWTMPIHQFLVGTAIATQRLSVPRELDTATMFDALYQGPGMDYIDPQREAAAAALELEHEVISRGHWQRRRGIDAQLVEMENERERARQEQRLPGQTSEASNDES